MQAMDGVLDGMLLGPRVRSSSPPRIMACVAEFCLFADWLGLRSELKCHGMSCEDSYKYLFGAWGCRHGSREQASDEGPWRSPQVARHQKLEVKLTIKALHLHRTAFLRRSPLLCVHSWRVASQGINMRLPSTSYDKIWGREEQNSTIKALKLVSPFPIHRGVSHLKEQDLAVGRLSRDAGMGLWKEKGNMRFYPRSPSPLPGWCNRQVVEQRVAEVTGNGLFALCSYFVPRLAINKWSSPSMNYGSEVLLHYPFY